MDILEQTYLGNSPIEYLSALFVVVAVWLVLQFTKWLLRSRIKALADRTVTRLDDLVVELLASTKGLILLVVAVYAGTFMLDIDESVHTFIRAAVVLVVLLQAAIWGHHLIRFIIANHVRARLEQDADTAGMIGILSFLVRVVFFSVIVLVALGSLGFDVTALVTTLGIGGIAIALALQNILSDLFASVSIALDKPFVVGDFINVGDFRGTVEYIGIKTTRVRSLSGEQLIFSNNDLLNSRLRNYKRMSERRAVIAIGVTYDTPEDKLAKVPGIIEEIIVRNERARFDRAHFHQFGNFSLNYEVVYWVTSPDYNVFMDINQTIHLEIVRRFRAEGIEFAYPTQTLFVQGSDVGRRAEVPAEATGGGSGTAMSP